jgi:hypothetical protein
MKKIAYYLLFLMLSVTFVHAQQTIRLEIIGNAEQVAFFQDAFTIEVLSYGYEIAEASEKADYTLRFIIMPQGEQFNLTASLVRVSDASVLASTEYGFTELEDMLPYNQLVIFTLTSNIPKDETAAAVVTVAEDDSWRNKWLYLRASVDFPIIFYTLKSEGLRAGDKGSEIGAYFVEDPEDPDEHPKRVVPLDNIFSALPALTLGVEIQVLNFLSIEPMLLVGMEHLNDTDFYSFAAGLEIKFPLKFIRHVMLEPYLGGVYPFLTIPSTSDIFDSFPMLAFGGGVQLGFKVPKGSVFLDVNYMYYWGDVGRKNNLKNLAPYPEVIHYQRSVIRIGLGYKFGLLDRKK